MGDSSFWVRRGAGGDGRVFGPFRGSQVKALAKAGKLRPADLIGASSEGPWKRAGAVKALSFASGPASTTPAGPRGAVRAETPATPRPAPSAAPVATRRSAGEIVDGQRAVLLDEERRYYRLGAKFAQSGLSPRALEGLNASLRELSDAGFPQATFDVAAGFDTGLSGTKDADQAWEWMKRAAHQGHPLARAIAVRLLMEGRAPGTRRGARVAGLVTLGAPETLLSHYASLLRDGDIWGPSGPSFTAALASDDPGDEPLRSLISYASLDDGDSMCAMYAAVVPASQFEAGLSDRSEIGVLTVAIADSDFARLQRIGNGDPGSLHLWMEHGSPIGDGVVDDTMVHFRCQTGESGSVPGKILLAHFEMRQKPDGRTKSGYREERVYVSHKERYRVGLSRRIESAVWRARSGGSGPNAPAREGHFPLAMRFRDPDVAKALGGTALGCEYVGLHFGAMHDAWGYASSESRSVAERFFWLNVAWQFRPRSDAPTGFTVGVEVDRAKRVESLRIEEWVLHADDQAELIELARRWTRRFWPGLGFVPLPKDVLAALDERRSQLSGKSIPVPRAPVDIEPLRALADAPIQGPQPPGITQMVAPVRIRVSALDRVSMPWRSRLESFVPPQLLRAVAGYLWFMCLISVVPFLGIPLLFLWRPMRVLWNAARDGVQIDFTSRPSRGAINGP